MTSGVQPSSTFPVLQWLVLPGQQQASEPVSLAALVAGTATGRSPHARERSWRLGQSCQTKPISPAWTGMSTRWQGRERSRRWSRFCETKPIPAEHHKWQVLFGKRVMMNQILQRASEKQSQFLRAGTDEYLGGSGKAEGFAAGEWVNHRRSARVRKGAPASTLRRGRLCKTKPIPAERRKRQVLRGKRVRTTCAAQGPRRNKANSERAGGL